MPVVEPERIERPKLASGQKSGHTDHRHNAEDANRLPARTSNRIREKLQPKRSAGVDCEELNTVVQP